MQLPEEEPGGEERLLGLAQRLLGLARTPGGAGFLDIQQLWREVRCALGLGSPGRATAAAPVAAR